MTDAADKVRVAITELRAKYPTTKVLALGGSQGAGLAYALAARGDVDGVVAVSGSLPPTLRPTTQGTAGIIGIHGTKDAVVPAAAGKATVESFKVAGFPVVEWLPIEGGTHALAVDPAKSGAKQALRQLAAM
ncbi:dienelactone hydrolase family protein [Nannocystis pusilla]|uniref:dienelactone hydrolase family protein n=1 Tax=Nannocystis pusilla TaxID=889268 RepID=UPI003B7F2205